ncbi:AMP-binding protein [Actinoplanes sp. L3-i22]|uniref:AMP-binding protein n=1 Tax=Actinoplanes sp. L3-i22 TaxID=2836373 RepID=UPI001C76B0B0|nr:AMP-binding protein [Actinoplanes sp. L3-i22]BCY13256.1 hypothetical protein L3i22_083440 [Actinoplanes sp. L3-i22]
MLTLPAVLAPQLPSAPAREPVLRVIARRAARTPGLVAVDDRGYQYTYAQLWHAAARTRRDLVEAGVEPGDVVAVAAGRGAELLSAILGIWLSGAACLPVGPDDSGPLPVAGIRAAVVAPGARFPGGVPVVPLVEVVAAPTEPPYAPVPDGDAAALVSRVSRSATIRLTHDDLATLLDRCVADPRLAAGLIVLEFFLPLVRGDRLLIAPGRPSE